MKKLLPASLPTLPILPAIATARKCNPARSIRGTAASFPLRTDSAPKKQTTDVSNRQSACAESAHEPPTKIGMSIGNLFKTLGYRLAEPDESLLRKIQPPVSPM